MRFWTTQRGSDQFAQYDPDLKTFGLPLAAICLISDFGSLAGGWMSSRMIKAGFTPNLARKAKMGFWAFCGIPIWFVQDFDSLWDAALLIGLATAAHQAFSADLYTLPSDLLPRNAVGSVIGIGGAVGALALVVVHVLSPRLAPVEVPEA